MWEVKQTTLTCKHVTIPWKETKVNLITNAYKLTLWRLSQYDSSMRCGGNAPSARRGKL